MRSKEELERLARDNYADYMMGNPLDDDFNEDYENSLSQLSDEEMEEYLRMQERARIERNKS